jgi:hypothetical protein
MPVRLKYDSKGPYYQYGNHGKKYYYKPYDKRSKQIALILAKRQASAIKINQKR